MNIIDNIPGILIFSYLIYYLVNRFKKPGTPLSKKIKREEESSFQYGDFFTYIFLEESDSEFDIHDINKVVAYIDNTINSLASQDPFDIVCEINISIDGNIYSNVISANKKDSLKDKLTDELNEDLSKAITKYPKYYNCHCILRFYNEEPIFDDETLSKLITEVKKKIGEEINSNNTFLSEKFKALSMPGKFKFIQDYVNENGFTRIRRTIEETRWNTQNQKIVMWLFDTLHDIQYIKNIKISALTSNVNFWLFQLEFSPHIPYIPIILGSLFVHNRQYDHAFHFFNLAENYMFEHPWLFSYCLHLLTFIKIIHESEKELVERASQLIDNAQFEEAEKLLKAQKKLNPHSALVNSEILRLQKLKAYDTWSPEKEQEFINNYWRIVYKDCDPFFEDENILQGGIQTELSEHRKTVRDFKDIYEVYIASLYLGETLFEATYAIMICSHEIYYQRKFEINYIATSISRLVKEKPEKIQKILDHYVKRQINYLQAKEDKSL